MTTSFALMRVYVRSSRLSSTYRVQFEAAFGESSQQPAEQPIGARLSFYAHIWQESW